MAERKCAYYVSRVVREYEEPDRDDRPGSNRLSETVASNEQSVPLLVEEDGEIGAPETGESRFLVSYRSEEQLERKYRRDARILALVAAGLFLLGAVFLAVGVAAATGYIQFT